LGLIADVCEFSAVLANKADIVIRLGGKNFDTEEWEARPRCERVSQRKAELVASETCCR